MIERKESATPRRRSAAREIAIQLLYQFDIQSRASGGPVPIDVEGFIAQATEEPKTREFSHLLYRGAVGCVETSDCLIAEVAEHWTLERIAPMDRAILRLAVFELNELPEVPEKVVINEAVELAKKFSTAQSGAFVNGILDRLLVLRRSPPDQDGAAVWDFGVRKRRNGESTGS